MKGIIDLLCQCTTDAGHLVQIFHTGTHHFLQTAKLLKKLLAAARPDTGDTFQWRHPARLATPLPVSADRESMRFIPNFLNQMQGRGCCIKVKLSVLGRDMQDPLGQLLGDLLVPLNSAMGLHGDDYRKLNITPGNCRVFHEKNHLDLLDDKTVHRQIIDWFSTGVGATA